MRIGKYRITFTEDFKDNMDTIVGGVWVFVGLFVIMAICCFVL